MSFWPKWRRKKVTTNTSVVTREQLTVNGAEAVTGLVECIASLGCLLVEKGVLTRLELANQFEAAVKLHGQEENIPREAPARALALLFARLVVQDGERLH
jgi:hypothetical protein